MAICAIIVVCAAVYALAVWVGQLVWEMTNEDDDAEGGGGGTPEGYSVLNWLDFLYFLSYVKASAACVERGVLVASQACGDRRRNPKAR